MVYPGNTKLGCAQTACGGDATRIEMVCHYSG